MNPTDFEDSRGIKVLRSIAIPEVPGPPVGLLRCVQCDAEGNLYASDEFNHRVISIAPDGRLRWSAGRCGTGPDEFRYPSALALGWVQVDGVPRRCVGVADAWNRRVQFLDLSGALLLSWDRFGSDSPGEIVDLRYFPNPDGEPAGEWFILDRTRHCVYLCGTDGRCRDKWGKALPPPLQDRWSFPGVLRHRGVPGPHEMAALPCLEYLFLPYRFVGSEPPSLFVWEPLANSLKAALCRRFIPVTSGLPAQLEWIAADRRFLLGWNPHKASLHLFDGSGTELRRIPCAGRPVMSGAAASSFWVQTDGELRQLSFTGLETAPASTPGLTAGMLALSAESGGRAIDWDAATTIISRTAEELNWFEGIAQSFRPCLARPGAAQELPPAESLDEHGEAELDRLNSLLLQALKPMSRLRMQLVAAWAAGAAETGVPRPAGVMESLGHLFEPLRSAFARLARSFDELQFDLIYAPRGDQDSARISEGTNTFGRRILARQIDAIRRVNSLYGPVALPAALPGSDKAVGSDAAASPTPFLTGKWPAASGPARYVIREAGRIQIEARESGVPARPLDLCSDRHGRVYVSLVGGNEVLCFDAAGAILSRVGGRGADPGQFLRPAGIFVDDDDRLWVADSGNGRVQVFDAPHGNTLPRVIDAYLDRRMTLPIGVGRLPDGTVLVADAAEGRVLAVGTDMVAAPWKEGLFFPASFCSASANETEAVWVVERFNHRLLKLDASGVQLGQIGGCGLERGCLWRPRKASRFDDGILVIAEDGPSACLVFMREDGTEVGRVDPGFLPGGVLVLGATLFVSDLEGSRIVWCRTRKSPLFASR